MALKESELKEILEYVKKNSTNRYWEYDDHLTSKSVHRNGLMLPTGNGLAWDTGETFNNSSLNAWTAYTPTLTNITKGSGTLTASYKQIGKTVFARGSLVWAADTSCAGTVTISLPVTSVSYTGGSIIPPIGIAQFFESGANLYAGTVNWTTTTTLSPRTEAAGGAYVYNSVLDATTPFTWGTSDVFCWSITYEAA